MPWSRFTQTIRAFMKQEVLFLIFFGSNSNHCNLWIPLKKLSKSDYKVMQNFFKRWYCTVPEAGYKYVLLVKPHPKKIGSARSSKIRWWRNIQATQQTHGVAEPDCRQYYWKTLSFVSDQKKYFILAPFLTNTILVTLDITISFVVDWSRRLLIKTCIRRKYNQIL